MAQRLHTVLISDLSGDEVEAGLESVSFAYRGVDYVIDLTAQEAAGFDKAIAMYVQHARPVPRSSPRASGGSGSGSAGSSKPSGPSAKSHQHAERIGNVKKWATDQGLDYPRRGRLPKSLLDAYDAAH